MNEVALKRAISVIESESESFSVLTDKAGLSPLSDFVHADLSGLDLRGEDLRGFDFTGAKFDGAEVGGAQFNSTVTPEQLAKALRLSLLPPPLQGQKPALFFDLGGVLSPTINADQDLPNPATTATLHATVERFEGRIAIVSGRTIAEVDRLLGGAIRSVAGVQGLEYRLPDGSTNSIEAPVAVKKALKAFLRFGEARPGIIVEDKGVAAGIHFRQAPEERAAARELASELALKTGLLIHEGESFCELRPAELNKGAAVRRFMSAPPFDGACPIFLGDDLADEAGFEAANTLGGYGVLIGPVRASSARYGLRNSAAVLEWLRQFSVG